MILFKYMILISSAICNICFLQFIKCVVLLCDKGLIHPCYNLDLNIGVLVTFSNQSLETSLNKTFLLAP